MGQCDTLVIAHGWRGKRARAAQAACDALRAAGRAYDVAHTQYRGHAIELAVQAMQQQRRHLIAVGGDGTLHEVAHGMMSAGMQTPLDADLSVIPCGSGNDVARMIGLATVEQAAVVAASAHPMITMIDMLDITYQADDGTEAQRWCINVADVGLGGHVVRIRDQRLRMLPGPLGYMVAVIGGLMTSRRERVTLSIDGTVTERTALTVCVANNTWFGGGLGIAPMARWDDGIADVVTIGDVGIPTYVRYLPHLRKARRIRDRRIDYAQGRHIRVEHAATPMPLEVDGEYIGTTPINVRIAHAVIPFRIGMLKTDHDH